MILYKNLAAMRELLYLSESKLNAFDLAAPRGIGLKAAELGVELGVVNGRVEIGETGTAPDVRTRFGRVIERLNREATSVTDRGLRPHQWIAFDMDMGYGTAHEDTAPPHLPDDVVLFGGDLPHRPPAASASLLLCGSAGNLLDRCAPASRSEADPSRMGSGTGWLYEMIKTVERMDEVGDTSPPSTDVTDQHRQRWGRNDPEEVAQWVYGVIAGNHPDHQRGRLSGLARVLMHVDDEARWINRLIVATPLYVEYRNFTPIGRWSRRWRNRRPIIDREPMGHQRPTRRNSGP
ncbi:SAVMC3_10250 family protein [Actinocorallia lasiicapitis]